MEWERERKLHYYRVYGLVIGAEGGIGNKRGLHRGSGRVGKENGTYYGISGLVVQVSRASQYEPTMYQA